MTEIGSHLLLASFSSFPVAIAAWFIVGGSNRSKADSIFKLFGIGEPLPPSADG